jgi:hypothetical protein
MFSIILTSFISRNWNFVQMGLKIFVVEKRYYWFLIQVLESAIVQTGKTVR